MLGAADSSLGGDGSEAGPGGPALPPPPGHDTRVALEVLGAVTLVALCAGCIYCQCEYLARRRTRRASLRAMEEQILDGTEKLLSATRPGGGRMV